MVLAPLSWTLSVIDRGLPLALPLPGNLIFAAAPGHNHLSPLIRMYSGWMIVICKDWNIFLKLARLTMSWCMDFYQGWGQFHLTSVNSGSTLKFQFSWMLFSWSLVHFLNWLERKWYWPQLWFNVIPLTFSGPHSPWYHENLHDIIGIHQDSWLALCLLVLPIIPFRYRSFDLIWHGIYYP